MNNPGFINKAQESVVDKVKAQHLEYVEKNERFYSKYFGDKYQRYSMEYIESLIDAEFKKVSHPDFQVISENHEIDFIIINLTKKSLLVEIFLSYIFCSIQHFGFVFASLATVLSLSQVGSFASIRLPSSRAP